MACLSELKEEKEPWPVVGSQQQEGLEGQRRWEELKGHHPLQLQKEAAEHYFLVAKG
jgi:hypothetical protein